MTPNEITTLIASSVNKPFDEPFKLMIIKRVDAWRARLIRNTLEQNPQDRKFFRQTIYLALTKGAEVDCDLGIDLCDVASSARIPKVLRANGITFDYLGAINGANPFQEVMPGMILYANKGKYSKNLIQYSKVNDKIVVYNRPNLPMIRVDAVWDNPYDVATLICGDTGNCDFWNTEYPCTNEILQQVIEYVSKAVAPTTEEISTGVHPDKVK
jgi:hypothetical protein